MNTIQVNTINGPMLASKNNKRRSIYSLCHKLNDYTAPFIPRTDHEHTRNNAAAKLIRRELNKYYRHGIDYKEFSDGSIWPTR